jgi:hypothetical protein
MPASRSVVSVLLRGLGDFSLHPQGRPCGRPPAAAVLAPATTRREPGTRLTAFTRKHDGLSEGFNHPGAAVELNILRGSALWRGHMRVVADCNLGLGLGFATLGCGDMQLPDYVPIGLKESPHSAVPILRESAIVCDLVNLDARYCAGPFTRLGQPS